MKSTFSKKEIWAQISAYMNKRFIALISITLCLSIIVCGCSAGDETIHSSSVLSSKVSSGNKTETTTSAITSSEETSSNETTITSSDTLSNPSNSDSSKTSSSTTKKPTQNTTTSKPKPSDLKYNTNLDIEDNVFMDSLIYTGYNMQKHRADGLMWVYILAKYKRAKGWLSNITYAGGSTGYETTANGKPNISYFEKHGFVCASFATYVYFNYLPNVAGIDTSSLPRPADSKLADSWYKAVQQWIKLGYSKEIKFTASIDSSKYIVFRPEQEIPIGSIIIFRPYNSSAKRGSHVVVYAGYKNGNHWVYHVGTKNGPEMCAVERMLYGPEPQWPLMVVTTPSNIRMAAALDLELKDDDGNAISGVEFTLKNTATGTVTKLGKTDKNGKITKEGLKYGDYILNQISVPNGYTASATNQKITLTPKNNSKNAVKVVNNKAKTVATVPPETTKETSAETNDSAENNKD